MPGAIGRVITAFRSVSFREIGPAGILSMVKEHAAALVNITEAPSAVLGMDVKARWRKLSVHRIDALAPCSLDLGPDLHFFTGGLWSAAVCPK